MSDLISKKRKLSLWLCGFCQEECQGACIFCDSCNRWFHAQCEDLSTNSIKILRNDGRRKISQTDLFTCLDCLKREIGDRYSFPTALLRLTLASKRGFKYLQIIASREKQNLPPFSTRKTVSYFKPSPGLQQDTYTESLLKQHKIIVPGSPVCSKGDGNCLFNSISISLIGNESLAVELRVRCSIEMATNKEMYAKFQKDADYTNLCDSFENACIDCAEYGSFSTIWTMIGLCYVIGLPINSIYPPMNGTRDLAFRRLNTTIHPSSLTISNKVINIAWTRLGSIRTGKWFPNHFVPIVNSSDSLCLGEDTSNCSNSESSFEYDILPQANSTPNTEKQLKTSLNSTNASNNGHEKNTETSPFLNVEDSSYNNDSDMLIEKEPKGSPLCLSDASYSNSSAESQMAEQSATTSEVHTSVSYTNDDKRASSRHMSEQTLHEGRFLGVDDVYKTIITDKNVSSGIPLGPKSNVFFLVNFTENLERKKQNKKFVYSDDCGVWDSKKGTTANTVYLRTDNNLRTLYLKMGKYCIPKKVNGKRTFVAIQPQPPLEDLLVMHRSYSVLKRDNSYQKRVTHLNIGGKDSDIALVEYIGDFPPTVASHGNSKHHDTHFIRTDPKVLGKIEEKVANQKPRDVYSTMVMEDSFHAPRDFKQVKNIRQRQKKQNKKHGYNIADDILDGISLIGNENIVRDVHLSHDKSPSFVLYTDSQMLDLKYFLENSSRMHFKLGVDRTFNLGPFFVTAFVYKNLRLVRKDDKDQHPLFLGPIFLHRHATYHDYHMFFAHVKSNVSLPVSEVDIRIPKDIEIGSSMERTLPMFLAGIFLGVLGMGPRGPCY